MRQPKTIFELGLLKGKIYILLFLGFMVDFSGFSVGFKDRVAGLEFEEFETLDEIFKCDCVLILILMFIGC